MQLPGIETQQGQYAYMLCAFIYLALSYIDNRKVPFNQKLIEIAFYMLWGMLLAYNASCLVNGKCNKLSWISLLPIFFCALYLLMILLDPIKLEEARSKIPK